MNETKEPTVALLYPAPRRLDGKKQKPLKLTQEQYNDYLKERFENNKSDMTIAYHELPKALTLVEYDYNYQNVILNKAAQKARNKTNNWKQ